VCIAKRAPCSAQCITVFTSTSLENKVDRGQRRKRAMMDEGGDNLKGQKNAEGI